MPTLAELLTELKEVDVVGDATVSVSGIAYDSRRVHSGDVFVAIRGEQHDGHRFVQEAIRRGAAAIVLENSNWRPVGTTSVIVPNTRLALAYLSAAFHGNPSRWLRLVGVTGTDGKTTTAYLVAALLRAAGYRVGLISTVDVQINEVSWRNETSHTTPQAPELQALLAKMVSAGVDYAVLEVSSHALALDRVAACHFDVAVITNLTPEHLDFHRSFEEYRYQKSRLFSLLGEKIGDEGAKSGASRAGVINFDDSSSEYLVQRCPATVISYAIERKATVTATSLELRRNGASFSLAGPFGEVQMRTRLTGRHNVYNWLAAIATAVSQGATPEQLVAATAAETVVPGRLERINVGQPFGVVVDFAHTPNGLAHALDALRAETQGRLIVVFGHPGGRDVSNRPLMGEVAGRKADLAILTSDDVYDESPEAIIADIAPGLKAVGRSAGIDYFEVPDRCEAIGLAIRLAQPGDTVLLAGRGHEQHTTVAGRRIALDDAETARDILSSSWSG